MQSVPCKLVPSPLNYTGGKYRILSQILEKIPDGINSFVDLFCGGCVVGINASANCVYFNDDNGPLIGLLETFYSMAESETFKQINAIIDCYGLSKSSVNGYEYYHCSSQTGLANFNRDSFNRLKSDFNSGKSVGFDRNILLYVLIVYSFNNQIRFNAKGQFNLPVGKRDFNKNIQKKLHLFITALKEKNCVFSSYDFRDFIKSYTKSDSFFYVDPPYLITDAVYNESGGWTEKDEKDLLDCLDYLDNNNYKFALSNVIESSGRINTILRKWLDCNKNKYFVKYIDSSYSNSNYHKKNRTSTSVEVLITNY